MLKRSSAAALASMWTYLMVAPSVPWHLIPPMPCVSIISEAAGVILRGSRLTAHSARSVNKAALMNEEDSGGVGIVSPFTRRGKGPFTDDVRKISGF